MFKAAKKNRVLQIPNEKRDEYESLGYTIRDEKGKVLYEPEDKDAENKALKSQIAGYGVERDALIKECKELRVENTELKEKVKVLEEQSHGEDDGKKVAKEKAAVKKEPDTEKKTE